MRSPLGVMRCPLGELVLRERIELSTSPLPIPCMMLSHDKQYQFVTPPR